MNDGIFDEYMLMKDRDVAVIQRCLENADSTDRELSDQIRLGDIIILVRK